MKTKMTMTREKGGGGKGRSDLLVVLVVPVSCMNTMTRKSFRWNQKFVRLLKTFGLQGDT